MSYYAVLTELGATLIEQAYQAGRVVEISHMAIGDGNGVEVEPSTEATSIAGEFDRVPLTSGASLSSMIGGGVDYESGVHSGQWIRTLGLIDTEGNLIVYANCTPSLIVSQSETLFSALSLNIQLPIVNGDAVTVIVERPPYPPATPDSPGVVRFATEEETLEGKVPDAAVAPRELAAALELKSDADHTHSLTLTGDVTGSATLGPNGVTMTVSVNDDSHGHSIGTISGLQNALDNKAAKSHVHNAAQGNADIVSGGYEQVGTYGILYNPSISWIVPGTLVAGSSLRYATLDGATVDNGTPPAGTWKALTYAGVSKTAFFIRVA